MFARTRADVSDKRARAVCRWLRFGRPVGEMDQAARNRALAAFKRGDIRADRHGRGGARHRRARHRRVGKWTLHRSDSYTHRSGRTGLAPQRHACAAVRARILARTTALLQRAGGPSHGTGPTAGSPRCARRTLARGARKGGEKGCRSVSRRRSHDRRKRSPKGAGASDSQSGSRTGEPRDVTRSRVARSRTPTPTAATSDRRPPAPRGQLRAARRARGPRSGYLHVTG